MKQLQTIQGTIADISRPLGPRGNWYIATIMPGQMKVTGVMPPVSIGDFCEFTGKTKVHPKFGEQFNADSCRVSYPRTETGIRRYFEMKCPGIGPAICERLFTWLRSCGKHAGDIWEVLRDTPDRLKEVKGISEKKLAEIIQWFAENESRRENDLFFVQNGITQNLVSKIKVTYNLKTDAEVIELIKENPYRLADDVHGIGFKKADKIAMSIGIPKDNPFRIEAGLAWTLSEFAQEGHVFAPENEFSAKACSLLDVGIDAVKKATANARNNLRIIIDGKAVYLPELHRAEKVTARRLKELVRAARTVLPEGLTEEDFARLLDPDQIAALDSVCKNGVSIVTGGPGVGKTFLLRKILETLGAKLRVKLAAPTGKAAKRMSESTGHAASTIHRLLEYSRSKGEFTRNEENPIEADLVAIDETSMLDISLAADLLSAIPDGCRIIFIGDRNQLPSVGPGTVLADMISSGKIPVAELKTLHRQDAGSAIDMAARDMNSGTVMPFDRTRPVSMPYGGNNFVYHRVEKAEDIPAVIKCYIQKITSKTEYRLDDIQVLAPQKNTVIGVEKLNACLRDSIYNPDGKPIGNTGFRIGDKVMQIKNNYDLEVFNGEIGWIKEVTEIKTAEKDGRERTVSVAMIDFGDGEIPYPISLFDELRVAYCFTIHKSQGSEFPVVIMPVHTTHTFMINRELIYTGITRGKSHVILIGNDKAIARAATIPSGKTRHSGLAERMG